VKAGPTQAPYRACRLLSKGVNLAEAPAVAAPGVLQMQVEPVGRRKLPGRAPAFMSFEAFCRLVDRARPPAQLLLQGDAEPLLHPRFFDMVAYAVQRGVEVDATTRLPAFTARRAEECVKSGLRTLNVVLDPAPAGLSRRGLERLDEAKRRLGSRLPEVRLLEAAPAALPQRIVFSGQPAGAAVSQ
jgi:hypothetical protein